MATETRIIAALYVDLARGPYPRIPGVDCWGVDRDATNYAGPWPVVAHPPCGHWGRYHQKAKDDGRTGPIAVAQVRSFGGILEHPKDSKLWRECGIPKPGEMPDEWGGYTIYVEQGDWGRESQKPTWLYIVRVNALPPMPPRRPAPPSGHKGRGVLERLPKSRRHLTPGNFARWLVEACRNV